MPDLSKLSNEELLAMRDKASAPPAAVDLTKVSDDDLLKLRNQAVNTARPKTAVGESFLRGAAQGASLGFADEITAAGEALLSPKTYKESLAESRANYDAAQADNPKTYIGGNLVGGVATSLIPGVGLAKGATVAANLGRAAVLGGVAGAGTSTADPTSSPEGLKQFGTDVAKGAAIGGLAQGGFSLLGKGATALKPSELRKFSNVKGLKAMGFTGKELRRMTEAEKQQLGNFGHENGLVKAFGSLDEIGEKAAGLKKKAGEEIGDALNSVDDLVVKAKGLVDAGKLGGNLPEAGKQALKESIDKQFQFNMRRIGERIEKDLIAPNAKNPLLDGEVAKLTGIADRFRSVGGTTMKEGNVIKGTQGKVTNFNSDTVPQAFKKELYDIIKTEIDEIVAKTGNLEAGVSAAGGKAIGSADVAARNSSVSNAYQAAKSSYGSSKKIEEVAKERLGQLQGNREISLTDTLAGVAGVATGNPVNAVLLGGANKLARQYGDSVMSVGARKAAMILEKTPRAFGKFTGLLEAAAKKGGPALDAAHAALMKEPDYRAILENFEKSSAMRRRLSRP